MPTFTYIYTARCVALSDTYHRLRYMELEFNFKPLSIFLCYEFHISLLCSASSSFCSHCAFCIWENYWSFERACEEVSERSSYFQKLIFEMKSASNMFNVSGFSRYFHIDSNRANEKSGNILQQSLIEKKGKK